jgi:hypothetical protein
MLSRAIPCCLAFLVCTSLVARPKRDILYFKSGRSQLDLRQTQHHIYDAIWDTSTETHSNISSVAGIESGNRTRQSSLESVVSV